MQNLKNYRTTGSCFPESGRVMRKIMQTICVSLFLICVLSYSAQAASNSAKLSKTNSATNKIVKLTPNTSQAVLKQLPDNSLVELSNGKQVKIGKIRQFAALSLKLKQAKSSAPKSSARLKYKPAAKGISVSNLSEINTALDLPECETIQLPSGNRITVEQLKLLQPELEKRLGSKLSSSPKQSLRSGSSIQIEKNGSKTYWKNIFNKPDETILESPSGKRVTVGELKKHMPAEQGPAKRSLQKQN